jgi:hypothetical protein
MLPRTSTSGTVPAIHVPVTSALALPNSIRAKLADGYFEDRRYRVPRSEWDLAEVDQRFRCSELSNIQCPFPVPSSSSSGIHI